MKAIKLLFISIAADIATQFYNLIYTLIIAEFLNIGKLTHRPIAECVVFYYT
ncbi:hypothetical protein QUA00_17700 [Microcoleus sp. T2B6]|uniref:hypothetical protein n=1 Tax=Microcoleus sp. T2B6 TaxID=3055424 RepID=UPI002FD22A6A